MSTRQFMNQKGDRVASAQHTCVLYGGFKQSIGKVGGVTPDTGPHALAKALGGLPVRLKDFHGSLSDNDIYQTAIQHIRENFRPEGRLIIYGYSAGGMNAIELCKRLHSQARYYRDNSLISYRDGGNESEEVVVDLLVTIDAYNGKDYRLDRDVPPNVARNLNIYQTYAQGGTGSRGDKNWRRDSKRTRICNQDRSSQSKYKKAGAGSAGSGAHAIIDEDTNDLVLEKIEYLVKGGSLEAVFSGIQCTS